MLCINFLHDNMFLLVVEFIVFSVFADADRYEMQAVSIASPMKSPHRYSPSVYSHQVARTNHYHVFPKHQNNLFAAVILVNTLPGGLYYEASSPYPEYLSVIWLH